ncbi:hypothetical protein GCM10027418_01950 [Mariniluteicoccus endophyticus]
MIQESMEAAQALGDGELGLDDATSVVGLGMAALNAFLDPAGALVGAALGPLLDWVAANVSFVKEPLDLLLGDPPEIMGYAGTWGQASQHLAQIAQQHSSAVAEQIPGWTGGARDAYLQVQANVSRALVASAKLAQTMAQAVQVAGTIVAVLRELIWGMVKDLVISLVTNAVIAAAAAIPSLGSSLAAYTAWASAKVSLVMGKISMGISKVFGKLSKLTSRIGPLSRMFAKAAAAFEKMGAKFFKAAGRMPDGTKIPDVDAPDLPGTSSAGMDPTTGGAPGSPTGGAPDAPTAPDAPKPEAGGSVPPGGTPPVDTPDSPDAPKGPTPASHPPFGDPERIADPGSPVNSGDHPYLKPTSDVPETQGIPGKPDGPIGAKGPSETPKGWQPLTKKDLKTFGETPRPEIWPKGETRYRVVGDNQWPGGQFWTKEPPLSNDYLRSDLAVLNEWNGDHGLVSYSPTEDLHVWVGPAGPQMATGSGPGNLVHLPGGGEQVFVPLGTIPKSDLGNPDRWWIQSNPWGDD